MGRLTGQNFIVENRTGSGTLVGTDAAAKAPPDGYTLLLVASPHVNLEILAHNKPYQLMRDFTAVAMCCSTDAVMVVSNSVPAKTVKEFIELAKAKPGKLTFASSGPGSNKHLGGELFKLMTGTDILHVAYKGSTGARNDIVGGHVDMMFDEVPSVAPNVLAGQVRALGVTGKTRSKALPDVPTVSEAGVPGYEHTGWFGINAEVRAIVAKPEVRAYWDKQDTQTMSMTPAESEAFLNADIEKWTKVVKAANIKLE
jgi:tripartite-type tricarboxylate transporter receptor subunit TctC